MVGNCIPKSIMKATAFKILLNFPSSLSLLFRVICRQSNLHSCKESNYRFPSLFLEKNVKVPVYPVASCVREVQFQDLPTQSLPLQFINMNDDHLKMCILYLDLQELSNLSTLGRGRNLPVFRAGTQDGPRQDTWEMETRGEIQKVVAITSGKLNLFYGGECYIKLGHSSSRRKVLYPYCCGGG